MAERPRERKTDWKKGAFIALCVFPALTFLALYMHYPIEEPIAGLAFFVAFALAFCAYRLTGPLRAVFCLSNSQPSAITAMLGKFFSADNNGIIVKPAGLPHLKWLADIDFLSGHKPAFFPVFKTQLEYAFAGTVKE